MLRTLIAVALFLTAPSFLSAQSLQGVWRGTEVEVANGPDAGVTVFEHPRLLNYTDTHFFLIFETEGGPRPTGDSDQEISEAAQRFQAWGGTYIRDGLDIVYNRTLTLNPNLMLPEAQPLVRQIRTLTPSMLETQGTNDEGITTILRYERVE